MNNSNQNDIKELQNKLVYQNKNAWIEGKKDFKQKTMDFCEGYKDFLNKAKTEREFVDETKELVENKGFVNFDKLIDSNTKLEPGMKVYREIYNKSLVMAVIGNEGLEKGVNIVGAHIDSPRLDLKPEPLYETRIWLL